jgi:hypothetical protein
MDIIDSREDGNMTQKCRFLYKNLIIQGSFQSVGHGDEYFIQRTERLIILYSIPRTQKQTNDIYLYEKGNLKKIIHKPSSTDPLLYYVYWLSAYWFVLITLIKKKENWTVFAGHPIYFFLMSLQKAIRSVKFAYWIGDYFPGNDWKIRLYEKLKKHYHDVIPVTYYLSDRINKRMNGGMIQNNLNRRTVAWGMKPFPVVRKDNRVHILAFVGVIKPSQNIEAILAYLHQHPLWRLKLMGVCEKDYYHKLKNIILKYSLKERVWFPNTFIPEERLQREFKDCFIGLALYKSDKTQFTWYTDAGKIKTYLEFGLPVIMTDISSTTKDIRRFHCGEIVKVHPLDYYIRRVTENYSFYQKGVGDMIRHYEYSKYYDAHFVALRE